MLLQAKADDAVKITINNKQKSNIKIKEVLVMFFNRRKVKEDASQIFNENFGFNTDLFRETPKQEKNVKEEKNKEEETEAWAQWWNVNPAGVKKVEWKLHEKIVLSLEVLLIIYFVLWWIGLVPMF